MRGQPADQFWGKLERRADGSVVAWHPLLHHCADVAACLEALLQQRVLRRRLATLAGLDDLDAWQVARLSVLGAWHDLGKFNHGFQRKALPSPKPHEIAGHVGPALALLNADRKTPWVADYQQTIGLPGMLRWSEDPDTTFQLLQWSICHHGRPQDVEGIQSALWAPTPERNPAEGLRQLATAVRRWFPLAFEPGGASLPETTEFQHAFSGLVMLADWLGSNADERFFPYTPDEEAHLDRMPFARAQATRVLQETGIAADMARAALGTAPHSFASMFEKEPREAQSRTLELPLSEQGSVTVLESETGSGKTEAALGRYVRMFQAGLVDGLYFALPTRTAATQIHDRIRKAVDHIFGEAAPPVTLAVPGYLRVDDTEGVRLARFETLWPDSERERMRYRGWAAENSKRYLAGPIVVGTIDQVLFSALAVSHAHLRATALLRHLLVVDEIHASDAYMTRLLEEVLERHRKAGGHALLMSATLGSVARSRYLETKQPPLSEAKASPYPVVSNRPKDGAVAVHEVNAPGNPKDVHLSEAPIIDEPEAIAAQALKAARRGARVIVLRNTVKDCIATQRALESLAASEPHLLFTCEGVPAPHHSRFSKDDRTKLDNAIEKEFGKDSTRSGVVAVATQTIQQSLDLDADLLITDLCPADVLLQRLGRLHRHADRKRPPCFEQAQAVILVPASRDLGRLLNAAGKARGAHGFGSVYEQLHILEATWQQIEAHPVWSIPTMNRMLVEETTHPDALARIELGEHGAAHAAATMGKSLAQKQTAGNNTYDWTNGFAESIGVFEANQKRPTRLGEEDRRVAFEPKEKGAFGTELGELSIPHWLTREVATEAEVTNMRREPGRLTFDFGALTLRYDRLGLRLVEDDPEPEEAG